MTHVTISDAEVIGAWVAAPLFGANLLFNRDRPVDGTYGDVFTQAGATGVRYPGGSITEFLFDVRFPNRTQIRDAEGVVHRLLPLRDFMAWAAENAQFVDIVIPTRAVLTDGALGSRGVSGAAVRDIGRFVADLLNGSHGDAEIATLEIGNEYWHSGQMTGAEYGRVASAVALEIDRQIDIYRTQQGLSDAWEGPRVAVQIGQNSQYSSLPGHLQNAAIMDEFNAQEAAAVDAVIGHFYITTEIDRATDNYWLFEMVNVWQRDTRFGHLDTVVSEWNVNMLTTDVTGLRGASTLVVLFGEMVRQGVDSAAVWPLQQNTNNDLAGREGTGTLTIAGEMFRLLATHVRGMALDYRIIGDDVLMHCFTRDGKIVMFISSRQAMTQRITQDIDELTARPGVIRSTILGADGNPVHPQSQATLTEGVLRRNADGVIAFDLDAYETIMIEIMPGDVLPTSAARSGTSAGNRLSGDSQDNRMAGYAGNDDLFGRGGNDTLLGGAGQDRMVGGYGNDTYHVDNRGDVVIERVASGRDRIVTMIDLQLPSDIEIIRAEGMRAVTLAGNQLDNRVVGNAAANTLAGWAGNDTVAGAGGNDSLFGNEGNDSLAGGAGDDLLHDTTGNNRLWGGAGQDNLVTGDGRDALHGGRGHDTLSGGGGADRINGGRGDDDLSGGAGADVFVFNNTSGRDVVRDFTLGQDIFVLGRVLADAVADGAYTLSIRNGATTLVIGEVVIVLEGVAAWDVGLLI